MEKKAESSLVVSKKNKRKGGEHPATTLNEMQIRRIDIIDIDRGDRLDWLVVPTPLFPENVSLH